MVLYDKILLIYPDLEESAQLFINPPFKIQDDLDGKGPYIVEWNDPRPKPTKKQLEAIETLYNLNPSLIGQV
jgi:hypothetical protein